MWDASMTIKCLQQDLLPKLSPAAEGLPNEPFITLTELVSFIVWGAPLTPGECGSLRPCIYEEEAAHSRAPRLEHEAAAVRQATARFYTLLGHAVARSHVTLWGLKQVGDRLPTAEHARIEPTYLLTPRHHDLLDNELNEEFKDGDERRVFNRAAREREVHLVRYFDIKISAEDAALLIGQYHAADRPNAIADNPPSIPISNRSRKWRPLHVAIAWALTRDEQVCTRMAGNVSGANIFAACSQIEREMLDSGCFMIVNEIMHLDMPTRTVEIQTHRLVPGYRGCFRLLAEGYELRGRRDYTGTIADLPHAHECASNRAPLLDYLMGRWVDTFHEIMALVADGVINARGVAVDGSVRRPAGELPASSITSAMWIDDRGVVWEGPWPATSFGEKPRHWAEISLNWNELLCHFPEPNLGEIARGFAALAQLAAALAQSKTPSRHTSASKSTSSPMRGRRPNSYWAAVEPIVMRKLDEDGLPDAQSGDPNWSDQADLERFIADRVAERLDAGQPQPVVSTVRNRAVKWMAKFRSARSAEGR